MQNRLVRDSFILRHKGDQVKCITISFYHQMSSFLHYKKGFWTVKSEIWVLALGF